VVEGGPFALPEHTQDTPNLQLFAPGPVPDSPPAPTRGRPLPATREQLGNIGMDAPRPLMENWGLPWNSAVEFGGLASCPGGRSLYFGGWSPQYLASEMHTASVGAIGDDTLWPPSVVEDLSQRFFQEGAEQTGVTTSNEFLSGGLQ